MKKSAILLAEYVCALRESGRLTRYISSEELQKCIAEDIEFINKETNNQLIIK